MLEFNVIVELNRQCGSTRSIPAAGDAQPIAVTALDTDRQRTIDFRDPVQCSFQSANGAWHSTLLPEVAGRIAQLGHGKLLRASKRRIATRRTSSWCRASATTILVRMPSA